MYVLASALYWESLDEQPWLIITMHDEFALNKISAAPVARSRNVHPSSHVAVRDMLSTIWINSSWK